MPKRTINEIAEGKTPRVKNDHSIDTDEMINEELKNGHWTRCDCDIEGGKCKDKPFNGVPFGFSQRKNHGLMYGYWGYFAKEVAQECYLEVLAVGCGESEYSEAIKSKFKL